MQPHQRPPLAYERLTRHAVQRAATRAFSRETLDWLLVYGRRSKARGGAEIVMLDAAGRAAIVREIGSKGYARVEQKLSKAYAVTGADGTIITLAYRTRRTRTA